jgi:two-component system, cell cycle sensor histidine kinase and response regulator CckA
MKKLSPGRIVAVYVLLSGLWIAFSDVLLLRIVSDPQLITEFSIAKGFLFIAVTAVFLYTLISRYAAQRDRSEMNLRENRAMIAHILDTIPQSVFWKDHESVYLGCNRVFARAAGLEKPEQILGKTDFDLPWPREEAEAYRADDREVMENNRPKFHIIEPLEQADDTRLWIDTTKLPLTDETGRVYGMLGVYEDITDRKRAEDEHLSHLRFLEGLERIDRVIRQADSLERMLTDVLDTALSLFESDRAWLIYPCDPEAASWRVPMERTRAECPGALAIGVDLPTTPEVRQYFLEALNSDGPIIHDPKSGRSLPEVTRQFSVQSQIQTAVYPKMGKPWIFGMHQCSHARVWSEKDVRLFTEIARRIADSLSSLLFLKDLRESQSLLKAIIDNSTAVIYVKDLKGRYLMINRRFEDLFHLSEELVVGKTEHDVFPKEVADAFRTSDRRVLDTGTPIESEEIVPHDDGPHTYRSIKCPLFNNTGKPYAVFGISTDITDRKKLEEQLRQSQKMESIGTLAGGVAHDFNNILAAIVGYGSLLQMKMRADDPLREYLSQILASAERAASLTQSLLAFSRKQVISPRNIDLNESIRKVEKFLTRTIGEDVVLSASLSNEALMIFIDPTQIEQVLMNLATNARDAMPKGGMLMIETGRVELDDEYVRSHGFGLPGHYAVLTVSDTGEGMGEQTQQKIFEPFFTTKEFGRGTGLGLAIVYGIVKQNKGYINVYSEVGKGTTFKIYLPFVSSRAGESKDPDVQQPLQGGTEIILLAEDNESVRRLNKGVLREFGYTVIEAADGEEALKKFRELRDRISLFILDVIMPKKNGREVFEEARRSNPNTKVIFTSGYPADLIQKEGVLEKGLHFLSKPSSPQALLRMVREVLDQ